MTETSLDDIMSGRGEAVPDHEPTLTPDAPATPAPAEGSRDDKGRFAPKADPANTVATPPATLDTPVQQPGHVPIQALDSERNKRKELEDRYEREIRELREQVTRLSQPPKPTEPAAPPPTLWDAPDEFIKSQLDPVEQRIRNMNERYSERLATSEHGVETVTAAKQWMEQQAKTPEGQRILRELIQSDDPFDDLVKHYKSQSVLSEIGTDPEAYKQRVIQEYLASQQQQPQPTAPAPAPQLPTSFAAKPTSGPRGGQEYGGPRSLTEIMGGR